MTVQIIISKKLAYDRTGSAVIESGECDMCHATRPVLCVDTSDEEYGSVSICAPCIEWQFRKFARPV